MQTSHKPHEATHQSHNTHHNNNNNNRKTTAANNRISTPSPPVSGKRSVQFVPCHCCDSYDIMSDYQGTRSYRSRGSPHSRVQYHSPTMGEYLGRYQVGTASPTQYETKQPESYEEQQQQEQQQKQPEQQHEKEQQQQQQQEEENQAEVEPATAPVSPIDTYVDHLKKQKRENMNTGFQPISGGGEEHSYTQQTDASNIDHSSYTPYSPLATKNSTIAIQSPAVSPKNKAQEELANGIPQKLSPNLVHSSPKKTPGKGKMNNYRDSAVFSADDSSEEEREQHNNLATQHNNAKKLSMSNSLSNNNNNNNNNTTTNVKDGGTVESHHQEQRLSKGSLIGLPLNAPLDEKQQSAKQNIFHIMEKVGIEFKGIEKDPGAEKKLSLSMDKKLAFTSDQKLSFGSEKMSLSNEKIIPLKAKGDYKLPKDWEIAMNVNNPILQKACENIYDHVKQKDGTVSKQGFMDDLELRGILRDDPRISEFITAFKSSESSMSKDVFTACISRNISVIENAFTNSNIIYDFESFSNTMKEMFYACKGNDTGAMADYIPQLAKQNPDHWGLSVCTIDGQRFNVGDSDADWCIQSCSKPISYCLALEEHGVDKVHDHVGREPSGIQFNALKLNKMGRPHNPLINSGAIMVCSLIKNHLEPADRFDYVLSKWEQAAGGKPLGYANSVYLSERMTGDRNFALAYFMRENKAFPEGANIVDVLEFYFQCCSMTITTNYMSIVAATLANGGVCPITGEQVFSAATVKSCLSMMYSCGMYDYSGEFAFNIGLPAKSGVAGGVFVVVPNVMGMCTFSPRLDKYGNSARGVDFYTRIITKFNFHLFDNIEMTTSIKENPRKSKDQDEVTVEKIIKFSSVGDLSALRRLRIKNSDLSVGDYDRRTPMHLAASNGHLNVVKYLYESGGVREVNPIDRWLGTPYDDAIREGHHEVAEFLKSVGGRKGSGSPA